MIKNRRLFSSILLVLLVPCLIETSLVYIGDQLIPEAHATAPVRIQSAGNHTELQTGVYVLNISLTSTPISGDVLVACVGSVDYSILNTVTNITQANVTWTRQVSSTGGGDGYPIDSEIWSAPVGSYASSNIEIYFDHALSISMWCLSAYVCEYSGVRTLDKSAAASGQGETTLTGTTETTRSPMELWIGEIVGAGPNGGVGGASPTNGFTLVYNYDLAYLEKIVSETGTASTGTTIIDGYGSSYFGWAGCIATFYSGAFIVPDEYPTIQAAINAASDGDTVYVRNGTYSGPIVVDKALSLQGENRNATVIDGGSNEPSGSVVLVTANNVKINGFTIQHCRSGGNAISMTDYVNMTFSDNTITGCNEGIRILYSSGNIISNNLIDGCYYNTGLGFNWAYDNVVYRNVIENGNIGIGGDFWNITFFDNTIRKNSVGISENFYDCFFFHNNIMGNAHQMYNTNSSHSVWDNAYPSGGNYWSDYTGNDIYSGSYQNETGSDNIGDSPYIIDANNVDNYPLMSPYAPFENQTIYIRADGSVDPSGAPILRQGDLYTLTDNIYSNSDGIAIEGDNMTLDGAGYTLQGRESGDGINLIGINNVTIKNTNVKNFEEGIYLYSSSNNSVSGNNIMTNSQNGIYFDRCGPDNTVSGNNITANILGGVWLDYSSDNTVSGNNITNDDYAGIYLSYSNNNEVFGDNIANNDVFGISLESSSYNNISDNLFTYDGLDIWDSYSNVVQGNTVNGKPLIYLENVSSLNVDDAGQVILVNCNNILLENLNLSYTTEGLELWGTNNSEIVNCTVANDYTGILLWYSSHNSIRGNNISDCMDGIDLLSSSCDNVSGNNVTANDYEGIYLSDSSNNSISRNNITANRDCGIALFSSSNDTISENVIHGGGYWSTGVLLSETDNSIISGNSIAENNGYGVWLDSSHDNVFYHNNFVNNTSQVHSINSENVWDNGYPSGGNYWSDYTGTDSFKGPYQNITGSDGIGDTPYVIDSFNRDNCPLINPWVRLRADINGDGKVDIIDILMCAKSFGSYPGDTRWNPDADMNQDGKIDIIDILIVAKHFGAKT
jgi:parallel beta-helix repeat protein